jgi:hypothetical protein
VVRAVVKCSRGLKGIGVHELKCVIGEVAVIISLSFVRVYTVCHFNIGELPLHRVYTSAVFKQLNPEI